MSVQLSQPVEAAAVVDVDTPCRACGYSLRGLPVAGRCPECGIPVAESVHDRILARCNGRDVARTAGAMRFVLWATLGYVAVAATANLATTRIPAASVDAVIRRAQVRMLVELAVSWWRSSRSSRSHCRRERIRA